MTRGAKRLNQTCSALHPHLVPAGRALPGRNAPVLIQPCWHKVFGTRVDATPEGTDVAYFAMGCFWGAEKLFWTTDGVVSTSVGYQGGLTPNPTYEEVCTGRTAHAEAVRVVFDPARVSYEDLLRIFFENHDPTQGMRQGNDRGTQYRSAVYVVGAAQEAAARAFAERYQSALTRSGYGPITTEIAAAGPFYYAEAYHQQYLAKNPFGYCPVHATGVTCG